MLSAKTHLLLVLLLAIPAVAAFQLQLGGGPMADYYLGEVNDYYTSSWGFQIGAGGLINGVSEIRVRFGGCKTFVGNELIHQYRLYYPVSFNQVVIYRYPLSMALNVFPWGMESTQPFFGAEVGAETLSNFATINNYVYNQETGWGPDLGANIGMVFPLDDVNTFFLETGLRCRYSFSTRYVRTGEASSNGTSGGSENTEFVEHLLPKAWSVGLWTEIVWGAD